MSRFADQLTGTWNRLRPRTLSDWVSALTSVLCALGLLFAIGWVFRPIFADPSLYGSQDWDQMETHRYLVAKTILRFHQFPFWNPYACGGHPAWGGFEADPIVVSPWLPAYLFEPLPIAMRIEIFGSTLLGALGAWLLASRFTKSRALCAIVAGLYVFNSRWIMQITVGHTWHMSYAWTPLVLYFYDRSAYVRSTVTAWPRRDLALAAACLAMIIYTGGIYPLPHTAVALAAYGVLLSLALRSWRPLLKMVACGVLAVGLSAPRLLPIMEVLRRFPRLTDSPEFMDPTVFLAMLTSREQDPGSMPAHVSNWGWHEWGMYVGWAGMLAIGLGVVLARGPRERSFRIVGLALLVVGFGSFFDYAPWSLLHLLPVFSSQHVPSRWTFPALLLLACVAAGTAERQLARAGPLRHWMEIAVMGLAAFLLWDVGNVDRPALSHAFFRGAPRVSDSLGPFHTEQHLPPALDYAPGEWAPQTFPAVIANIGSIDCNSFPGFNNYTRGHDGRTPGLGARASTDPAYHGEAYIAEGHGKAAIESFSPNAIDVRIEGATPGDHVVLNQNWDPGWSVDGHTAIDWQDTAAGIASSPSEVVHFRYRPKTLWLGLLIFLLTITGPTLGPRVWRRFRARRTAPSPA